MIIDGRVIAGQIEEEIRSEIAQMHGRIPCLAVIRVGNHPPSEIYVKRKIKACQSVGILSVQKHLPENIEEKVLISILQELNQDNNVDGILVQLPLPQQINTNRIINEISPEKDVDGLHPINVGKLLIGIEDGFVPCTPLGIKILLQRTGIEVAGKHVVILGRSNLVGKPLGALLMQNAPGANATVTIAHRFSGHLPSLCQSADILIVAIGQPRFITADMVRNDSVVIDVGINKVITDNQTIITGDVDFDYVSKKTSWITPVPGGVGPMTIAMLLLNTLKSYKNRKNKTQ